jgi:tetratricopeptide (TPR) repeat protein
VSVCSRQVHAEGEPAAAFIKQLRAAGYYDLALIYLERLDQYPGVDSAFMTSVPLEKAQTYIDSAIAARSADQRNELFQNAEEQLQSFLKSHPENPRASEARAQLGKLRMFRASQFMIGEVDEDKRQKARELYQAASDTFDAIIEDLKKKIAELQGAKIDAKKEPEKAALRDSYYGEFMMAKHNAGESRLMAAETYVDPAKDGKKQLEEALEIYTDLSQRYGKYVQGLSAYYTRGKVEKTLGKRDLAFESFMRMLELDDIDELRDARIGSATEIIDLLLTGEKVDYAEAIKIGEPLQRSLRPNEQRTQIAQDLRVALARAFLAQNKDEANVKPNERKRALSDARKLLIAAKKISGTHDEITSKMLADIGIDADSSEEVATMPTADDPKSFADALTSARVIFQTVQDLTEQVQALTAQGGKDEEIKSLEESLSSARQTGIVILRRGLSMIHSDTETVQINEGRQFLAFLLLQEKYFRDSFVVGNFLANFAPGTEVGLSGGIIALNSAQQIISAEGTGNEYWVNRVKQLGDYLVEKWPNDPKAASAKGVSIIMALDQNDLAEAKRMIDAIPPGVEQAKYQRVLGQFYWNESLKFRRDKQDAEAAKMTEAAASELTKGLEQMQGGDVGEDIMQAAMILAKIRLRQDNPDEAVKVMDHPQYGPITLIKKLDSPQADLLFDLYRTELQAVVGQMTSATGDQEKLLARASESIDKMQANAKDEAGQKKLIDTFRVLAFDIQEQIKNAPLARQKQLIDAFNVFLSRISSIAKDDTTLLWVGQTMLGMAESAIPEGQVKADGQAAELLKTAIGTFETLKQKPNPSDSIPFMLGKSLRLQGEYSAALKEFREILTAKPTMIDAQEEAALAYEQWAAVLPAAYKAEAYRSALSGDKQKIIWGWGKISTMTQQSPAFRERFFVARYHVALCRFQQGQAANDAKVTAQAARDITGLVSLYPDMGGPNQFRQFDSLLKKIQIAIGENPSGLPEPPAPAPAPAAANAPR